MGLGVDRSESFGSWVVMRGKKSCLLLWAKIRAWAPKLDMEWNGFGY